MRPLEQPDSSHVQAAKGWCELKSFDEAAAELDKVAPALRSHPLVLEARWQVCANLGDWGEAFNHATAIIQVEPDWPNGWIYLANSLGELDRIDEAYDTLKRAQPYFPEHEIIAYDLACFCCTLNRRDEAREWVSKAIDLGGNEVKLKVLDDPELAALFNLDH